MATWPTLRDVRAFLRLQPDPTEDQLIGTALAAAVDYGNRRTNYRWLPGVTPDPAGPAFPDAVYQACLIHAARLYRRRDSIDGTLGFGDAGVVRVGRFDADIEAMYSSVGPVVFG